MQAKVGIGGFSLSGGVVEAIFGDGIAACIGYFTLEHDFMLFDTRRFCNHLSGCPLQGGEALNFGQSCSLGIGGKGLIVIGCLGQKVFYMSGKVPCPKRRIFENPTGSRVG